MRSQIVAAKHAAGKKGVALHDLDVQYSDLKRAKGKKFRPVDFVPRSSLLPVAEGYVTIDAIANPGEVAALRDSLEQQGLKGAAVHKNVVSGRLPLDALASLGGSPGLHHARPAFAKTNVGLVDSQGDVSMQSKTAKAQFGVTGAGQTVGVLSDSFDNAAIGCAISLDVPLTTAAEDVASGDLPVVSVVEEALDCGTIDEGRGMAQLIHDVAPGAGMSFHSAFNGYSSFAQGIIDLADAGATVIVDDVIYFAEPMFMDGLIAQAADEVNSRGIPYFSSAGNGGYDSYEDAFRSSGGPTSPFGAIQHDFDPGADVDGLQSITFPPGQTVIALQWDEPFFTDTNGAASSQNDIDVLVYDSTGFPCIVFPFSFGGCERGDVIQIFGVDDNILGTGDAVEIFAIINDSGAPVTLNLSVELFAGPTPGRLKYVYFDPMTINEYDTMSGSSYGKAMANGAFGTGASAWFNTRPFNPSCNTCDPARINGFSSAGGTPILFDPLGNRLQEPEIREKPNATGPDGADNTFFGFRLGFKTPRDKRKFPNFFGTSASAPHVAAVAALMLEANPSLDANDVFRILEATADDMDDVRTADPDVGFDFGTGYGFINAEKALAGALGDICHNGNTITVKNSGAVSAHLAHGDTLGGCEQ
jgi:subtilisin family serine protease